MVHGAKILFTSGENTFRLEQVNREHINPRGKHRRFSSVTYFFMSSLVKIWEIRVFSLG